MKSFPSPGSAAVPRLWVQVDRPNQLTSHLVTHTEHVMRFNAVGLNRIIIRLADNRAALPLSALLTIPGRWPQSLAPGSMLATIPSYAFTRHTTTAGCGCRVRSRPDATSMSQHTLSIEEVVRHYENAGFPRTVRTLQRYCSSGHLDCIKAATTLGDKFYVTPESVARHIEQVQQMQVNCPDFPGG